MATIETALHSFKLENNCLLSAWYNKDDRPSAQITNKQDGSGSPCCCEHHILSESYCEKKKPKNEKIIKNLDEETKKKPKKKDKRRIKSLIFWPNSK